MWRGLHLCFDGEFEFSTFTNVCVGDFMASNAGMGTVLLGCTFFRRRGRSGRRNGGRIRNVEVTHEEIEELLMAGP